MHLRDTYNVDLACPCESNENARHCCKRGKSWYKRPSGMTPPGPVTNFANPKCYLRATSNCCTKISREHAISATVLKTVGGDLKVPLIAGLRFQKRETFEAFGLDSLASKILCKRHNEAFSPVDKEAGRFFRVCYQYQREQLDSITAMEESFTLFNAADLRAWMAKTIAGVLASKSLESEHMAWTAQDLVYGVSGMFLDVQPTSIGGSNSLALQLMRREADGVVCGAYFEICGFRWILLPDKRAGLPEGWKHNPQGIVLSSRGIDKIIQFSWGHNQQSNPRKYVPFKRVGEYDGDPLNFPDR